MHPTTETRWRSTQETPLDWKGAPFYDFSKSMCMRGCKNDIMDLGVGNFTRGWEIDDEFPTGSPSSVRSDFAKMHKTHPQQEQKIVCMVAYTKWEN